MSRIPGLPAARTARDSADSVLLLQLFLSEGVEQIMVHLKEGMSYAKYMELYTYVERGKDQGLTTRERLASS